MTDMLDVVNPATGEIFARVPCGSAAGVDAAVRAAQAAFPAWAGLRHAVRARLVADFADAIDEVRGELARTLTMEQGKPLARATDEIANATKYLRRLVELPLGPDTLRTADGRTVEVHHRPLGVVAAITPWNVPVLLAIWKIGHALFTGNTMVLKPAPTTPLATLRLGEIGQEVFPAGVLNVVVGADAVGQAMIAHEGVAKVSFTGSVSVGRLVAAAAAASLKRVTLELGGNDAAIVLPDADVDAALPGLFTGAFTNAGQACMAIKRLYVHESLFDRVVDGLKARCDATVVGDGLDPAVQMGPVQNRRQFESVGAVIEDTRRAGVAMHVPPRALPARGFFIAPQLAIAPAPDLRIVREETFGPVLPVLPFRTVDEAVTAANASSFGLSGSVWTSDPALGKRIAERLEVGSAWVNRHIDYDAHVPFGGMKSSGLGRENSIHGLRHYTEPQAVYG